LGSAVVANLGHDVGDLKSGFGIADIDQLADILERVGGELAALLLSSLLHHAEAVKVLDWSGRVVFGLEHLRLEELVDELTVLELLLEVSVSLLGALVDNLLVEEVEGVVARTDELTKA